MKRRHTLLSVLGAVVLVLGLAGSKPAQAEVTVNMSVPIEPFAVFVPCANGGAGEVIDLSGALHVLMTFTMDGHGGVHGSFQFQPQGVTAVGESTGDIYHAAGLTRGDFNTTVGDENTFVNNFLMIGPGPGNNLLLHGLAHMTINANGTLTASVDRISFECK
jgi:hypothetical protein